MTKFVRTDITGLARDMNSKAIVATDQSALNAYRKRRETLRSQEDRISKLESDVSEILSLVRKLAGRN